MKRPFNIIERIKSFGFAFEGLMTFFKTQHNAWIHLTVVILAITIGYFLDINNTEWLFVALAITLVFASEMFNTAIEFLCDKISPDIDPQIKKVKDVAAAAVLLTSFFAITTGGIIFIPKLIELFFC